MNEPSCDARFAVCHLARVVHDSSLKANSGVLTKKASLRFPSFMNILPLDAGHSADILLQIANRKSKIA